MVLLAIALQGFPERAAALPRSPLAPWASATVPLNEPVYDDLDRLDALGLLPEAILGQRPLSRGEIARMIGEASRRPDAVRPDVRDLLIRLRNEYPVYRAGESQGLQSVRAGAAGTNAAADAVPPINGVGQIQAISYPLTAYREGAPFTEGGTFWFQTHHAQNIQPAIALAFRPDFRLLAGRAAHESLQPVSGAQAVPLPFDRSGSVETAGDFNVKAFYGRILAGPLVIQVGRDALAWGPVPRGGFHLSTNARPLDMILIGSESPFRLPGILRKLGPHRSTIFLADLGEDRRLPHALLLGIRTSLRPHRLAEVGFTEMLVIGGEGAPRPTGWQVFRQIFPIGGLGPGTDYSDHRFGFDLKLHAWPGRLTIYEEILFEDGRNGYWTDVTSNRTGLFAPALGPGGNFDARLEHVRLPAVLYRHGRWSTGYAVDGRILGDELGPDAHAVRTEIRWNRANGSRITLDAAIEDRDRDWWSQVPRPTPPADPGDAGDIFRLIDDPTERRFRVGLTGEFRMDNALSWQPRVAFEKIENERFVKGADGSDYIVELALALRLGRDNAPSSAVR